MLAARRPPIYATDRERMRVWRARQRQARRRALLAGAVLLVSLAGVVLLAWKLWRRTP